MTLLLDTHALLWWLADDLALTADVYHGLGRRGSRGFRSACGMVALLPRRQPRGHCVGVVRLEASRQPAAASCLAFQDVCGQGFQFGRPVRGGRRRPQDELREPDGQPLVDSFVQGCAALRDKVRGVEVWTAAAYLFDRCHWQRATAVGEVHAEVLRVDGAPGFHRRGLDALAFLRGLGGCEQAGDPPVA